MEAKREIDEMVDDEALIAEGLHLNCLRESVRIYP